MLEDQVIKREDGFVGYEEESMSTPPRRFNVMTKGLKSLAWNIHKILKRKSFSSADELSQTI